MQIRIQTKKNICRQNFFVPFFLILFSLLTYKRLNYGSIKVHFFPSLHLQNNNRRGILFEQKNNDPGFHWLPGQNFRLLLGQAKQFLLHPERVQWFHSFIKIFLQTIVNRISLTFNEDTFSSKHYESASFDVIGLTYKQLIAMIT